MHAGVLKLVSAHEMTDIVKNIFDTRMSLSVIIYFHHLYLAIIFLSAYRAFTFKLLASNRERSHRVGSQHLMVWRSDE